MSRTEPKTVSHPARFEWMGEEGEEAHSLLNGGKGFISHHGLIVTSGMTSEFPFAHPIRLTSYGSPADALKTKNVYLMSCRLIGSNTEQVDDLHFETAHRINLGDVDKFGPNFIEELMDKVSIVALGVVVARDIIRETEHKGKPTVVITIKHVDYDPISRGPVTFHTKHFLPPVRNLERAQNLCQLGRELQLHGIVKDYNTTTNVWECEVNAINVCNGPVAAGRGPAPIQSVTPNGGRIALNIGKKFRANASSSSVMSSPSAGALDSAEVENLGTENTNKEGHSVHFETEEGALGVSKRARRS